MKKRKDNKAIISIGLHKIHNNRTCQNEMYDSKLVSTGRIEGTFDDTTFNPPSSHGINIGHWERKRLEEEYQAFLDKIEDRLGWKF